MKFYSLIEREKNASVYSASVYSASVYSPRDWIVLMRQFKTKNVTINAELCDHSRFFDVKSYPQQFFNFHQDKNGAPISN